jgi:TatD DNase family protein
VAFDAHTHLDMPAFDADREAVLARAGVRGGVICAADPVDWDRVERVGRTIGWVWTLGLHPWWCRELDDRAVDGWLAALAARPTPWGIGETGLDRRAAGDAGMAVQLRALRGHLALARERDVPVVLHVVGAMGEALDVLRADGLPAAGGMVHSWSAPADQVGAAVALGLYVSFSGSVCRSRRIALAAASVPADRLLVETDAPDQAVEPGARGEPADLPRVAAAVAAARGASTEAVLAVGEANARRLFRLG